MIRIILQRRKVRCGKLYVRQIRGEAIWRKKYIPYQKQCGS